MRSGRKTPQGPVNYDTWKKVYEHTTTTADTDAKLLTTAASKVADTGQDVTEVGSRIVRPRGISFYDDGYTQLTTAVEPVFGNTCALLEDWVWTGGVSRPGFDFYDDPFTIEMNMQFINDPNTEFIPLWEHYKSNTIALTFYINNNRLVYRFLDENVGGGTGIQISCPFNAAAGVWYHLAVTRVNKDNAATAYRLFIDGVAQPLTLDGGSYDYYNLFMANQNWIGGTNVEDIYIGGAYIDEIRISRGISRWQNNFTLPTEPYESDYFTELLGHFEGYDKQEQTWDSTKHGVIGENCWGWDQTYWMEGDDYLTIPDSADWTFGTDDFTIDTWIRFVVTDRNQCIWNHGHDASNRFEFTWSTSLEELNFYATFGGVLKTSQSWSWLPETNRDSWYHLALVRDGNFVTVYIDGVSLGTKDMGSLVSFGDYTATWTIGSLQPYFDGAYFGGYMDAFRIVKGEALWTSAFTPPTTADEYVSAKSMTITGLEGTTETEYMLTGNLPGAKLIVDEEHEYDQQYIKGSGSTVTSYSNVSTVPNTYIDLSEETLQLINPYTYVEYREKNRPILSLMGDGGTGATAGSMKLEGISMIDNAEPVSSLNIWHPTGFPIGTTLNLYRSNPNQ
jgi:hypothetical protein